MAINSKSHSISILLRWVLGNELNEDERNILSGIKSGKARHYPLDDFLPAATATTIIATYKANPKIETINSCDTLIKLFEKDPECAELVEKLQTKKELLEKIDNLVEEISGEALEKQSEELLDQALEKILAEEKNASASGDKKKSKKKSPEKKRWKQEQKKNDSAAKESNSNSKPNQTSTCTAIISDSPATIYTREKCTNLLVRHIILILAGLILTISHMMTYATFYALFKQYKGEIEEDKTFSTGEMFNSIAFAATVLIGDVFILPTFFSYFLETVSMMAGDDDEQKKAPSQKKSRNA